MDRSDSYREANKCSCFDGSDSLCWIHDLILRHILPWYEFSYFQLLHFGNFISDLRFVSHSSRAKLYAPMKQKCEPVLWNIQAESVYNQQHSAIQKCLHKFIFDHEPPNPISFCVHLIIPGEIEKVSMNHQEKGIWHCIKIISGSVSYCHLRQIN